MFSILHTLSHLNTWCQRTGWLHQQTKTEVQSQRLNHRKTWVSLPFDGTRSCRSENNHVSKHFFLDCQSMTMKSMINQFWMTPSVTAGNWGGSCWGSSSRPSSSLLGYPFQSRERVTDQEACRSVGDISLEKVLRLGIEKVKYPFKVKSRSKPWSCYHFPA